MSHRVDPMPHRVKATRPDSSINRFFTEAAIEQLPPPHHPVLPARESRNRSIVSAKPREPFFKTG